MPGKANEKWRNGRRAPVAGGPATEGSYYDMSLTFTFHHVSLGAVGH